MTADLPTTARRRWLEYGFVLLLATFGAFRVAANCASFPPFGNIDEVQHVDILLKYSEGRFPSEDDSYLPRTEWLNSFYASPEYLPDNGRPPPPAVWTPEMRRGALAEYLKRRALPPEHNHNYEAFQPPIYYLAAAAWTQVGAALGYAGGIVEVFWARSLGAVITFVMILLGYLTLVLALPLASAALRLGVPALLAVWPQDCLYFVSNDGMGCLVGALVILLGVRTGSSGRPLLGFATGLAGGLGLLIKVTQILALCPLGALVAYRSWQRLRRGERVFDRTLILLLLGFAIPVSLWSAFSISLCGDMFGTSHKVGLCGFQPQTWDGLLAHPMWSPQGAWTFLSNLNARYWFGESFWAGKQMRPPMLVEFALLATTVVFLLASLSYSLRRGPGALRGGWFVACWGTILGAVAMDFGMSLAWDFGTSYYPSREFPFIVSGRLLTASMVPFAVVYVDGLYRATRWLGSLVPGFALAAVLTTLIFAELQLMLPVLESQLNFWNLRV